MKETLAALRSEDFAALGLIVASPKALRIMLKTAEAVLALREEILKGE